MPEQAAAAPNPLMMLPMFGMMFLIFYVIVFLPQRKARKEHEAMIKHLKKNDYVVTTGGVFGTVVNTKPDAVTLRIDDNVRIDVEPSAIIRLVKPKAQATEPALAEKR
ncbi:MAG: preprotein translocase subunit YajC [Candidatus Omnitrophica bacterium]|nr:preprotein translocase subunit YajC [Candidatus Omnitrophota bacterium]